MASVVRAMEARDVEAVKALNKGEFPANFLSLVYEREGRVTGWVCCSVDGDLAVAHGAVSSGFSPFAARRLAEAFESSLRSIGLYLYVFGVHVKRTRWLRFLDSLGIHERYAAKGMHIWFRRRLR